MTDINIKANFTEKKTRNFKAENLYVQPKGFLRGLIQKLFLKLLSKLFPKKFLSYKNKIRLIMNRGGFYLRFYLTIIYLRLCYPRYFSVPSRHLYAIGIAIKFLKILKPQKIDFFLIGGSLLGAIRQEAFAGRPSDIDFGIKEEHLQKLLDASPLLIKNGVRAIREYNKNNFIQFLFSCTLVDVVIFKKKIVEKDEMWVGKEDVKWVGGETKWLKITKKSIDQKFIGQTFPIEDLEHLITVKAYGKKFLSPANPEIYLEKVFGINWKIPDRKQFVWKKN